MPRAKVPPAPSDDQPDVVAYRVGQLEETQKDVFDKLAKAIEHIDTKLSGLATVIYVDKAVKDLAERISGLHDSVNESNKDLEEKYVSRRELKVLLVVLGGLGTVILIVLRLLSIIK